MSCFLYIKYSNHSCFFLMNLFPPKPVNIFPLMFDLKFSLSSFLSFLFSFIATDSSFPNELSASFTFSSNSSHFEMSICYISSICLNISLAFPFNFSNFSLFFSSYEFKLATICFFS